MKKVSRFFRATIELTSFTFIKFAKKAVSAIPAGLKM
jgi:hypothetical protein